jgi:hypothetical protein
MIPLAVEGTTGVRSLVGMRSRFIPRQNLVRAMGVALAVVTLIFIVQTLSHSHPNGQEQAACQLCQIAHAGILATACVSVPIAALVPTGQVEQSALYIPEEHFSSGSPARAPPTEVLL